MVRVILVYGLAAGLIVITPMLWSVAGLPGGPWNGSLLFGYLVMLLALTGVFLGVKHYRDQVLGGTIGFWTALGVGLGISVVASLLYVAGWELTLALSKGNFAQSYARAMVAQARARGASPQQLQEAIAQADSFVRMYSNPLYRTGETFMEIFPVGVLVSLVSAGLLRFRALLPARAAR
jgi:hypothetical protein